ncbi:DUF1622 domain-containing protein [Deinococcus metallilatus]|uniref:DUF1622 domain-containing protein n=1 Tax=Deinococcus metallilatus TaxID=1211322 RepID=A0AAJ5F3F4_9DEIO|nr:DUF1622 domain-containing protein [Deinococcus metallilatus]MBB5294216.1 putative membrane protein [Deinococcus metallilatus]QBY08995.1 DUF1622 domain-containing protein [Deinococcus metallilatus]RXJ10139.1 DUF1622 domain-containing protein [Deinococcus metallilatus]TLK27924.1 DUF1622 domain-containing protein [Deinococcus metallilatus]GMA16447.1 hypothetical protein GCM10025871_27780 [Deinococcus metallilatus]
MEGSLSGFFAQFEATVGIITQYLATGVEGVSGIIVGIAVIEAVWSSLKLFFVQHEKPESLKEAIRLRLGRWLSVVLEFLLAADILRTAVAPNWSDIGKLAAIAGIRTALNYFLGQEVREEARSQQQAADASITQPIRREQG